MKRTQLLVLALASVTAAGSAVAEPVGSANVPSIINAADLIVIGRAGQPSLRPDKSAETVTVSVDRVLKGRVDRAGRVTIRLDRPRPSYVGIAGEQYGIFLVRAAEGGVWVPVDPRHPTLPASPTRRPAASSDERGLSAVAAELLGVLDTPPNALTDPRTGVQDLVSGTPEFQAGNVYLAATEALQSVPYAIIGPRLREAARSDVLPGRLWALNALLGMDRSPQIDALNTRDLKEVAPLLVRPPPGTQFAVYMLANTLEGHVTSPDAVPVLSALLESSEVTVRRAAASALSDIATPAVIQPLAKMGLNDKDEDVRYYAVLGLAAATHAQEPPPMDAFKNNPSVYEGFWHNWANANVR